MHLREVRRTTTFRLSILYGLVFALATGALLGMVYLQSAVYLTHRVDLILNTEAERLERLPPPELVRTINDTVALNDGRTNVFGLFTAEKGWIAGNIHVLPNALAVGGRPVEMVVPGVRPRNARLLARKLPGGAELVVGRAVDQLREITSIIASALLWSGGLIVLAGLACGTALSIGPLRRLELLQKVSRDIAAGDLKRRMPITRNGDELDMLASAVNHMIGEVERLMSEVKSSTETLAHDLRTPLTRARARLHRLGESGPVESVEIMRVTAELDEVLERFRAIMRITELEARERQAGFSAVDVAATVDRVIELYQPLAEDGGVRLSAVSADGFVVCADQTLLFEALSNLVDNAIKFNRPGGSIAIRLERDAASARIVVEDDGLGIPADERSAVLQRFYRGERHRLTPGSGLGLSIVAAILRMHGFALELQDATPGLRVVIDCSARVSPPL